MKIIASLKKRWVVWVWRHTPNCVEMSRLASQSLERPLAWRTRLKMQLHFLICVWCQRYFKQLRFSRAAASHLDEHPEILPQRALSPKARQRIVQRLKMGADKKL